MVTDGPSWHGRMLSAGHTSASGLLVGSSSVCWRLAGKGCVGLPKVLFAYLKQDKNAWLGYLLALPITDDSLYYLISGNFVTLYAIAMAHIPVLVSYP